MAHLKELVRIFVFFTVVLIVVALVSGSVEFCVILMATSWLALAPLLVPMVGTKQPVFAVSAHSPQSPRAPPLS